MRSGRNQTLRKPRRCQVGVPANWRDTPGFLGSGGGGNRTRARFQSAFDPAEVTSGRPVRDCPPGLGPMFVAAALAVSATSAATLHPGSGGSGGVAPLVGLRLVHDHGDGAGLPAHGDAQMADQRAHEGPREPPVRPFALDRHGQRLVIGDAGRPDEGHHLDRERRRRGAVQVRRQGVGPQARDRSGERPASRPERHHRHTAGHDRVRCADPGPVGLEAFEIQLPPIVVRANSRNVTGSMPPTHVNGSFAPF